MYGSLFEGDFVVINKMAYGARLPMTPLALKINGSKKYVDWIQLPYIRLFGYSDIKRNDVIAFNYALLPEEPTDMQEEFVKRCVALPGDTFKMKDGLVYANSTLVKNSTVYNVYKVTSKQALDTVLLKKADIFPDKLSDDAKSGMLLMNERAADSLSKLSYISSVVMDRFAEEYYNPTAYPHFAQYPWNYDHFGPLWIPAKGDSILLNKSSLVLYQQCIENYEHESVVLKDSVVFISGKALTYYTFKLNYYFVIGDNRHNSIDSRTFGLIPEDHIIGKASVILYSSKNSSRKFIMVK